MKIPLCKPSISKSEIDLVAKSLKSSWLTHGPYNLKFDADKLEATVLDYCDRDDIQLELDELLVIEYYSRR